MGQALGVVIGGPAMSSVDRSKFAIVGGGLGGALMAIYLGRAGHEVDVYEMRDDLRTSTIAAGRSINLALSHRGICALQGVGLAEEVLSQAVSMPGRMIHSPTASLSFQPYGEGQDQVIHSVSRAALNAALLNAATRQTNVRLIFNERCTRVDLDSGELEFTNGRTGVRTAVKDRIVVGADGAFSAVRRSMQRRDRFNYRQDYLEHGYKELTIPSGPGGEYLLAKNSLHIWPRRSFMMIALPNADGSFTCTLFWPLEGNASFAALKTKRDVVDYFAKTFPDVVGLIPTLDQDYFHNPTSTLVTIRCDPWFVEDRVVLLGDACHAVVPFYGQGMNAAFEDVIVLSERLALHGKDRATAFAEYQRERKRNVDALADLAIENFVEMRDHTGSHVFRWKKKLEKTLHRLFPNWFIPLYTLVTFTRTPYAAAARRARRQNRSVVAVAVAVLLIGLIGIAGLIW